jgi:hypothetical protein
MFALASSKPHREPRIDGWPAMKSISRSFLARSLKIGVASLALGVIAPAVVRAETVSVQGEDGANGTGCGSDCNGSDGDPAPPVAAIAGSASHITSPVNQATATGGSGGGGGGPNFFDNGLSGTGNGGNGGTGGAASATAGTTILSGSAEANANSYGGNGGFGGGGSCRRKGRRCGRRWLFERQQHCDIRRFRCCAFVRDRSGRARWISQ